MSVGFEDPDFLELCGLLQNLRAFRTGDWRTAWLALRQVGRAARLARSLRRLPRIGLGVTNSPSGRIIRAFFRRGRRDRRPLLAISTLALPADVEEYRRGRSRQALRTNSAKARRAGVTVVRGGNDAAVREHMQNLFHRRNDRDGGAWYFQRAEAHEGEFWFALGPDGASLALCEVIVDESLALLRAMISAPGPDRSNARFLLMHEVLASLAARGVRHLVVDRAFWLPPGLVYFQRLLGFVPTNLTLVPHPEPTAH
jgi:hypothetical protein